LANDRGVAAEIVPKYFDNSKRLAASLGSAVDDLPARGLAGEGQLASRPVLNYLFVQTQRLGRDLAQQFGADHTALCEVAVKSNVLRVLYSPGSQSTEPLAAAIGQAAQRAQLPANLWQPVLDLAAAQRDGAEVRRAVQTMHTEVERYLAGRAEP
jgi:hypothetical protein